jgi:hypothetical protein
MKMLVTALFIAYITSFNYGGCINKEDKKDDPTGSSEISNLYIPAQQNVIATYAGINSRVTPQTLIAYGGEPLSGYTWTVSSGSAFPSGTTVEPLTGVFKGAGGTFSLRGGSYSFRMDVSDGSHTATGTITLVVTEANSGSPSPSAVFQQPIWTNLIFLYATTDEGYGASLYVMGGIPPYSWSVATGSLPPGLVLDASRGVVRGTPFSSASGQVYDFTVKVTDSSGSTAVGSPLYKITVIRGMPK